MPSSSPFLEPFCIFSTIGECWFREDDFADNWITGHCRRCRVWVCTDENPWPGKPAGEWTVLHVDAHPLDDIPKHRCTWCGTEWEET